MFSSHLILYRAKGLLILRLWHRSLAYEGYGLHRVLAGSSHRRVLVYTEADAAVSMAILLALQLVELSTRLMTPLHEEEYTLIAVIALSSPLTAIVESPPKRIPATAVNAGFCEAGNRETTSVNGPWTSA
ncbi:uncharacterized protein EI97DRAFT_28543 [Westerdykella ornata]|uniref:Uncharacterized protein n=1 Tax=Westerdykella ornata TaxID=318751 RepID=A0A6A6JYD0_WESOR|nr:uncharacterized protein EI97DRAFT_28543 [Westerdykella ornata]KAF2281407.1 hypothetical protein EI97DRAFT_28543 [Westerdykella ornata]